jgi:uncharacterized protein (TIGR02996 family)
VNDHDAFLRAIFKQPDDQTARLVYADWLDENDHPGGELIRIRHQLAVPSSAKSKRALVAREKELVAACDQDWLERLEHADWKLRYLKLQKKSWGLSTWLRQRETYWRVPTQKSITRALAAIEKQIKKPLPRSWKAFAHGCGPGELAGWFYLAVPTKAKDVPLGPHGLFSSIPEVTEFEPRQRWLRNCVAFGTTAGSGYLVWDTSKVTDPVRNEYRVIESTRNLERDREFKSFEVFWEAALVPPEPDVEYDAPFEPSSN